MNWIQILTIVLSYCLLFFFANMYGFHNLYLSYRRNLFSNKWEKPDNWHYTGSNSRGWCTISKIILIAGFASPLIFAKEITAAYKLSLSMGYLFIFLGILLYCCIIFVGLLCGRLICKHKIRSLCKTNSLEFPEYVG